MRKRYRILLVVLLAAAVCGWAWQGLRTRGPQYQGRGMTAWLTDLNTGPLVRGEVTGTTHDAGAEAFRHMGTNTLPRLLAGLRAKDSRLEATWHKMFRNPPRIGNLLPSAGERRAEAAQGFKALGAIAKPAIPELATILNDPDTSLESAFCLAFIGPDGIPPLIQALTNHQPQVRGYAAFALGYQPTIARAAVPTLLKMSSDPDADVRIRAFGSLMRIDPQAAANAGVK